MAILTTDKIIFHKVAIKGRSSFFFNEYSGEEGDIRVESDIITCLVLYYYIDLCRLGLGLFQRSSSGLAVEEQGRRSLKRKEGEFMDCWMLGDWLNGVNVRMSTNVYYKVQSWCGFTL